MTTIKMYPLMTSPTTEIKVSGIDRNRDIIPVDNSRLPHIFVQRVVFHGVLGHFECESAVRPETNERRLGISLVL